MRAVNLLNKAPGILGLSAVLILAGCNGTLGDSTTSTTTDQSATGYWSGTDSVSGLTITGLINAAGQANFIRGDGVQFTGIVQVSGSALAAEVDGFSNFAGSTFSDGSTYGVGTLNGTVTSGDSITASLSFTTSDGTDITGSWSLTFQSISNNASSTSAIMGTYTDTVTGGVLSINSGGAMSEPTIDSCVLSGSVSTNDTTHDLYEVSYSYAGCTGAYLVLNGVQFTGLASLNPGQSPALVIAVTGDSTSNVHYGVVSTLNSN
jgi:hypothetical protein